MLIRNPFNTPRRINYTISVHRSGQQVKVNYREKEKDVLDKILGQGSYDARIRPSGINGTGEGENEIISI